jgi:D-alanyl-D-alanine carboxypeptidase/D-alanyl-D-alanine-endopeptidase (penicillin-binding protein 4)
MKRTIFFILTIIFAGTAFASVGEQEVTQVLQSFKLKNADVGVYAVAMPGGKVLMDVNKDEPLNPASCMKLVTSAVALRTLGANYQFPTKFYLSGNDLWVRGFGDPSFVIERMEVLVARLIASGLPRSIGNIYVDDSYFGDSDYPGRQRRSKRAYNAPTGALSINHSAITVEVLPSGKIGAPPIVNTDAPGLIIENKAKTSAKRTRGSIRISRVYTKRGDTVFVSGHAPIGSTGKKIYFNVARPAEHFGMILKALLAEKGVNITGEVLEDRLPQSARFIYEDRSSPLYEVLKDMNKFSSNFMAEQITKVIGAAKLGEPGTTEKGTAVSEDYLKSLGATDFFVENGSGLSYRNRLSARDLFLVMKDIYDDPRLRNHYVDSLSVAGEDGTLRRAKSGWLNGRLKAKTGSLNGVSTLAGFLPDGNKTIVFVVFLNGNRVDFWTGRRVSQKIAETLLDMK